MTMKTALRYTLTMMLVASLSAGAAATAAADEAPQRTVHFADLNPNLSAGAAALYSRIRIAAAQVCERVNASALSSVASAHRCMDQAIARAVADVNTPALSGYYMTKTGQTVIVASK
jgi:UrcA family protein